VPRVDSLCQAIPDIRDHHVTIRITAKNDLIEFFRLDATFYVSNVSLERYNFVRLVRSPPPKTAQCRGKYLVARISGCRCCVACEITNARVRFLIAATARYLRTARRVKASVLAILTSVGWWPAYLNKEAIAERLTIRPTIFFADPNLLHEIKRHGLRCAFAHAASPRKNRKSRREVNANLLTEPTKSFSFNERQFHEDSTSKVSFRWGCQTVTHISGRKWAICPECTMILWW
jgi:hypothetical protein